MYELAWPWRDAATAMTALAGLMTTAPGTLSCRIGLGVPGGGPATGGSPRRSVDALGQFFGPAERLEELWRRCSAAAWPSRRVIREQSWLEAQKTLAHSVPFGEFASRSRFLDGLDADTAVRWLERWPGSSNPGGAA